MLRHHFKIKWESSTAGAYILAVLGWLFFFKKFLSLWRCWTDSVQFSSVSQSCPTLLHPMVCCTARLPCPSPIPGACSNSRPSRWWCHPTISSSVLPFSHLQSFPASVSVPMSWFFTSGGQSIGWSFSFSISPSNEYSAPGGLCSQNWDTWVGGAGGFISISLLHINPPLRPSQYGLA